MGQTTVQRRMSVGLAGQWADFEGMSDGQADTATSTEASAEIPFGVMVKRGATDGTALLMTSTADVMIGISLLAHGFAEPQEIADTDAGGLKPTTTFGVGHSKPILVIPEDAVTPASEVHVRYSANGSNTQVGSFRGTADAGHTLDISAFAQWKSSSTGTGTVAALTVNIVNAALAAAD